MKTVDERHIELIDEANRHEVGSPERAAAGDKLRGFREGVAHAMGDEAMVGRLIMQGDEYQSDRGHVCDEMVGGMLWGCDCKVGEPRVKS